MRVTLNDEIRKSIQDYTKVYLETSNETISDGYISMLIDMLVEKYIDVKSYPSTWSQQDIEDDVTDYFESHSARIASKIPEIYGRMGAEGEISHNENGINRSFGNASPLYDAFPDVVPFAYVL